MCNKYLREGVKMTELNSMQWKDKSQWAWIETQEILFKHKENLFLPVPVSPPPFFCYGDWTLEQAAERGCGLSSLVDTQNQLDTFVHNLV